MNFRKIFFTILISFAFTESRSQNSPAAISTISQLTDSIKVIIGKEHIAGVMLGITTKDSIVFSGGLGYSDVEKKKIVDGKTLFRLGSVTKMFISLGIMTLVEEGKLSLNDELKNIAPEVPFQNQWETSHPVRIVNLLEHTSGFDDIKLGNMYSFDSVENSGFTMVSVHHRSLITRWKPGERTAYANPNYAILGYILQKFSGKRYDEYLKDIILSPLGMIHSNFNTRSKHPDLESKEYIVAGGRTIEVPHVTLLSGPQGALWSCTDDMVRFLQLFLKGGNPLFSAKTIDEIETSHSSLAAKIGLKTGYALGNRNCFLMNKYPFRGHDGLTGTFFSGCYYNRDLDIGFVLSSNSNVPNDKIENLVIAFLENNKPEKQIATEILNQPNIEPFLGWYQFESPRNEISSFIDKIQNVCHIYIEGGQLYSKSLTGRPIKLLQTGVRTFAYENMNTALVLFTTDEGKKVMCVGGTYYEKKPAATILFYRLVLLTATVIALTSVLNGIMAIVLRLLKRISTGETIFRLLPFVGMISLAWGIQNLLHVKQFTFELAELHTMTPRSLSIFMGTLIFGTLSVLFVILTGKKIIEGHRPWYMLLVSISLLVIVVLLSVNGWIGLRTWAM